MAGRLGISGSGAPSETEGVVMGRANNGEKPEVIRYWGPAEKLVSGPVIWFRSWAAERPTKNISEQNRQAKRIEGLRGRSRFPALIMHRKQLNCQRRRLQFRLLERVSRTFAEQREPGLERTHDQNVNQDHDAETQNEQRQLLDFQVVSALVRVWFGVHGVIQFAIRRPQGQ